MRSLALRPIATNQNEIAFANGNIVFFSYSTPVAAFVPGEGYIKTSVFYSTTTSKHINKWTENRATVVPQIVIDTLLAF